MIERVRGSTTACAPMRSASVRRIGEKSPATIGSTPFSFSAAMTARPTGPQPTTSAASCGSRRAFSTACIPTAMGSVSAACSVGRPLGTGSASAAERTMSSP